MNKSFTVVVFVALPLLSLVRLAVAEESSVSQFPVDGFADVPPREEATELLKRIAGEQSANFDSIRSWQGIVEMDEKMRLTHARVLDDGAPAEGRMRKKEIRGLIYATRSNRFTFAQDSERGGESLRSMSRPHLSNTSMSIPARCMSRTRRWLSAVCSGPMACLRNSRMRMLSQRQPDLSTVRLPLAVRCLTRERFIGMGANESMKRSEDMPRT